LKGGIANQSPPEPELRYPRVSGQRRRPIAGSSLALRKCAQQVGVVRSESQQRFEGTFSLGGVMSCQSTLAGVVGALEILERSSAARQADGNQSRRADHERDQQPARLESLRSSGETPWAGDLRCEDVLLEGQAVVAGVRDTIKGEGEEVERGVEANREPYR